MEIPINYKGNVQIQVICIYNSFHTNNALNELSNKESIIREVTNYGSIYGQNKTFLYLSNVCLEIIFDKHNKIYESVNIDLNHIYLIKVIKLC